MNRMDVALHLIRVGDQYRLLRWARKSSYADELAVMDTVKTYDRVTAEQHAARSNS